MPSLEDLRKRSNSLFFTEPNNRPVILDSDLPEDLRRAGEIFKYFFVFDDAHQETALRLAARLMKTVDEGGGNETSLEQALGEAAAAMQVQDSDLVKYALSVFITHHPVARPLHIPPIQQIKPLMLMPSNPGVPPNDVIAQGGLGVEARIDYFREANQYNEHHEKWHRVFHARGYKDKQGELFWYMHQQMLARYDTDRIARDLPPVVPLSDYRQAIEGYEVEAGQSQSGYTSRDPDQAMRDLPGYTVARHEQVRDRVRQAISRGSFQVNGQDVPITRDLLGAVLEPNLGARVTVGGETVDLRALYGSLHNWGHGFIASLSPGRRGGVMGDTSGAVRDPVFYRWHRHVDDLFVEWQQTLDSYNLADGAPGVRLRKDTDGESSDIGLALLASLPGSPVNGAQFDGATFGRERFGGANWDQPLSDFTGPARPLTDTLITRIATETIELANGNVFRKFIVDHDEFAYFFRLENTSGNQQRVTVRVFLAAADRAEDRRWWIEMDKFLHTLAPGEKAVVYRPTRFSSVVRKPALRPSEGPASGDNDLCDCGWPFHMLLPRGTEAGMSFRLFVMLTDAEQDLQGVERRCGSVSFCGTRDSTYPDRKEMGYPFNRPFKNLSIAETIASVNLPHVAGKTFTISHAG